MTPNERRDVEAERQAYGAMERWRIADRQHDHVAPWVGYKCGYIDGIKAGWSARDEEVAAAKAENERLRLKCDTLAKLSDMVVAQAKAERDLYKGLVERVVKYTRETPGLPDGLIQACREALARKDGA
ncbi:MAG TPA: hypothetical protein VD930_03625 [Gemmatimonadales bacterium]|nr:hypothetical protein [Gemmatimonadales bacterium]